MIGKAYPVAGYMCGMLLLGSAVAEEVLVLTSAPRGDEKTEKIVYEPIATFLTQTIGKHFIYRWPGDWANYQQKMLAGEYDLILDGPHFAGYRVLFAQHVPIMKMDGKHVFVVFAKHGADHPPSLDKFAGKVFCVHAPPNLGTLTLLSKFESAERRPSLKSIKGWKEAYDGVMKAACHGSIAPEQNLAKLDPTGQTYDILYKFPALPNQVLTAGPRIDKPLRESIQRALFTTPEGNAALAEVNKVYAVKAWVPAEANEYVGHAMLLKNTWGFKTKLETLAAQARR